MPCSNRGYSVYLNNIYQKPQFQICEFSLAEKSDITITSMTNLMRVNLIKLSSMCVKDNICPCMNENINTVAKLSNINV